VTDGTVRAGRRALPRMARAANRVATWVVILGIAAVLGLGAVLLARELGLGGGSRDGPGTQSDSISSSGVASGGGGGASGVPGTGSGSRVR
jgi:uncharacterized membrane protein